MPGMMTQFGCTGALRTRHSPAPLSTASLSRNNRGVYVQPTCPNTLGILRAMNFLGSDHGPWLTTPMAFHEK
jgi:hypothetical protein